MMVMMNITTVGPCLSARSVVQQSEAWVAYGLGGASSRGFHVTEFMMYRPYILAELVNLGKQFWQTQGETFTAWLLQLWDTGVGLAPVGSFVGPYWEK